MLSIAAVIIVSRLQRYRSPWEVLLFGTAILQRSPVAFKATAVKFTALEFYSGDYILHLQCLSASEAVNVADCTALL